VLPLSPAEIERLRRGLRQPDATLISVLAYAGLRPGEALALRWGDIRERTILVARAVSMGEVKDTKTGQARTVQMLGPLAQDLAEFEMARGRPADHELVFPRPDGNPWTEGDWRNWRRRVFRPAASKAALGDPRPYDLRHSFCSLLIAEGRSIVEVARQAGHSATMTLSTYGHVIDEFAGGKTVPAEEAIRSARNTAVPLMYPGADDASDAEAVS
jgi:integrase